MKLAFSTVACPEWTMEQVVSFASSSEFDGVELRTFGFGSSSIACDPAHTAASKLREALEGAGVTPCSLGTGCRFDEPIFPPVIGRVITDIDRSVRDAKSIIHMAAALDVPFVRVFGFEYREGDNTKLAERRVVERLSTVVDAARNTGVKIVLENGGSFPMASDIARVIAEVDHPLLGASYSPGAAIGTGESPIDGVNALADRLWMVKLKDVRSGVPCPIGEGTLGCEGLVRHLSSNRFSGWVVVEWDRLWMPELGEPGAVLAEAASRLRQWSATPSDRALSGSALR